MHLQTDVFCSAALVLPDKAARILNVGGWSLTSTYGIRLYAPDGSPGVNGTNDWEENPNELQLQVRMAYPSLCDVYQCSLTSLCREDVGIRRPLSFPMAVSSLWAARQDQTPHRTRRLRFSLVSPVAIQQSTSTGSSGQTQTASIRSCMFSLVVAYSLVSWRRPIFYTTVANSLWQDTTMRHASSTRSHSPLSKSSLIYLAPSRAGRLVVHTRWKVHHSSCHNMPPTRIQSLS